MVMGKLSKWVQECPKTKMNDRTRNAQKEPSSFVFYLYTLVMREGIRQNVSQGAQTWKLDVKSVTEGIKLHFEAV